MTTNKHAAMKHSSITKTTKGRILTRPKRPATTMVFVAVCAIGTGISLVGGLSILRPGTFLDAFWKLNPTAHAMFISVGGQASGVLLLCLGVLTLVAGFGLFKGYMWSWWLTLCLLLIVASVNISRFVAGDPGEYFGTPLTLCLLWLHTQPNIRRYFGIRFHIRRKSHAQTE